jgi:hypothetical protein
MKIKNKFLSKAEWMGWKKLSLLSSGADQGIEIRGVQHYLRQGVYRSRPETPSGYRAKPPEAPEFDKFYRP